jgi:hypothetical protein
VSRLPPPSPFYPGDWENEVPVDVQRELYRRHGRKPLVELAWQAMQLPDFKDDFEQLGARVVLWSEESEGRARVPVLLDVPARHHKRFVALLIEAMLPGYGRDEAREDKSKGKSKGKPGRHKKTVSDAVVLGLLERGLERHRSLNKRRKEPGYKKIADEFDLARTWATEIVKWAEKHPHEARRAIATSEIPTRFSAYLAE